VIKGIPNIKLTHTVPKGSGLEYDIHIPGNSMT
jgi:hypothetical protein